MREYLPVLMFIVIAIAFAAVTLIASAIIVPGRSSARRLEPYECGVEPIGSARQRVDIPFYLAAVMFILFDVEIVFLYPWAVAFHRLGLYGLVEMLLFVAILLVGYAFLLKRRALDWSVPS